MDPAQREATFLEQAGRGSRRWNKAASWSLAFAGVFGLVALYGFVSLVLTRDSSNVTTMVLGLGMVTWQMTLFGQYRLLEGAAIHLERSRAPVA
ncbi:MAG: hypothetical protein AABY18_02580 [Candidatus Thermoplasmatota archaeon]